MKYCSEISPVSPLTGALNWRWGMKKSRFWTNNSLYFENDTRHVHVARGSAKKNAYSTYRTVSMTVSDSTQTWISNPCFGVKFITTAKHILRLFTFWYTGSPTILFFGKRNIKIPTGFPLTWALNACWAWEIVGFDHYLHFSTFASHTSRWCFNYRPDMYSEQINGENKLLSVKLETLRYLVAKTAWSCDEYERVTDRRTDGRSDTPPVTEVAL